MNPLAYAEAAVAALAVIWLAVGLFVHPAALGSVALFALLPLTIVALPALAVRAFGDRPVRVRRPAPVRCATECRPPSPGAGVPSDD